MVMAQERQLTPQEKAMLFNQNTRQHLIALPSRALPPSTTVEIETPKVRLTSRILLELSGTVTIGGTGTATLNAARAARFIRNLSLS